MLATGSYDAKGVSLSFGKSPEKGTPCVIVKLQLLEGPDKGATTEWVGWLTENTEARTGESLRLMGYDGVNDASVGANVFSAVIEHEPYTKADGTPAERDRVAWVNARGAAGRFQQMSSAEVSGAKERLKAAMTALKAKSPVSAAADDDVKF